MWLADTISTSAGLSRKGKTRANLQLILHGRIFLVLATHGEHPFFEEERTRIRDCREAPIRFASYAIAYRGGHASVRIDRDTERDLKAYFHDRALWSEERLSKLFSSLPFEPYAPIRRQLLVMLNQVNRIRKSANRERLPTSCLRLRRKPKRPFGSLAGPGSLPRPASI